ncbi:MAG TPA: TauD/TfdA family dioxygenase [Thermoanaerobaculia bacterium]|nr:TauD/TfdA family dioxygenase [Thermoanaerobaculia bacterium]
MKDLKSTKPDLFKLGVPRRRTVSVSEQSLVTLRPLYGDADLPLVVEPAVEGVDLVSWAGSHRELLDDKLTRHGGILFRGFGVGSEEEFERFIAASSGDALEYKERSSPRHQVSGNIYTSTDHPPDQPIFLHNEHSYSQVFPLRIFFYCKTAAQQGGATPLADTRRIKQRLPAEVVRRFAEKGYAYVRNFGDGFGLSWQTAFQTDDRARVEEYCRKAGIEMEWKPGDRLRTRQVRPALTRHPVSGDEIWFNHVTFFHVTTLQPEIRDGLLAQFAEEDLPNNTYYGDGTSIEPEVLDTLRGVYAAEERAFPWQEGDVLMLDNMLAAHGREPFQGARKVLVGMAQPIHRDRL